jgi:hypothetical protein
MWEDLAAPWFDSCVVGFAWCGKTFVFQGGATVRIPSRFTGIVNELSAQDPFTRDTLGKRIHPECPDNWMRAILGVDRVRMIRFTLSQALRHLVESFRAPILSAKLCGITHATEALGIATPKWHLDKDGGAAEIGEVAGIDGAERRMEFVTSSSWKPPPPPPVSSPSPSSSVDYLTSTWD